MKIVKILIVSLLLMPPSAGFCNITFDVTHTEDGNKLVITDESTGKNFDGPSNQIVSIDTVKDFDGDGIDDALIISSAGGNCCPEQYSVVTLKNNQVITADFDAQWSEITAIDENGAHLIREKTAEVTNIYSFNGGKLVLVRKIPKLKALKEVVSPGGVGTDKEERKPVVLIYDINNDRKKEKIVCPVWERWGSITCILPLPNKKEQQLSIGCDRFGVLPSMNNGFHEFVCNNDTIITFDGTKWIEKK